MTVCNPARARRAEGALLRLMEDTTTPGGSCRAFFGRMPESGRYRPAGFTLCNGPVLGESRADFAPSMRTARVRFKGVFEDGWQRKPDLLLAGS